VQANKSFFSEKEQIDLRAVFVRNRAISRKA
jgi:hypothetical protein